VEFNLKDSILNTLSYSPYSIISPDPDGLISAKLLNRFNGSIVVGTYDKNILTIADGIDPKEVLYVDCDMNKEEFVSIGNHMRLPSDNISTKSFNPNVHFNIKAYDKKFCFATCFLITFATELKTSDFEKNFMAYSDSTYKNLEKYGSNMEKWASRIPHDAVERIFSPIPSDHDKRLQIEKKCQKLREQFAMVYGGKPTKKQSFVNNRFGKSKYISAINDLLVSENIQHRPIIDGVRYTMDIVGKPTVMKYNQDIISYARTSSSKYSITYEDLSKLKSWNNDKVFKK